MPESKGRVDATLDRLDALQQASPPSALVVALITRCSDDRASRQAALITFYGFLSVFPLFLIGHRLQRANAFYGTFAVVFGLIFWINLAAQLFLYSTELNLVVAGREWPRSFRAALT